MASTVPATCAYRLGHGPRSSPRFAPPSKDGALSFYPARRRNDTPAPIISGRALSSFAANGPGY